jgi:hypothetical protein
MKRLIAALGRTPFRVPALVLLLVFAVTRMPYFWYGPPIVPSLDSGSYLGRASAMREGKAPEFLQRTPGYPVFIFLVTSCLDRWMAVVLAQNLLSLASALCLVYAVQRLWRPLALPATLAMCGFLGSSQVLFYDISLLSESLYTSTVILAVACLFLAFALERAALFALASALLAWAFLVRPAGAYVAVIFGVILAYTLWNRYGTRAILGFAAPFPALLLCLCAYNSVTSGKFALTANAEANLAGATLLFWEPDPRLPAPVNKALEDLPATYSRMGITPGELYIVRNSWDPGPLFDVYAKAYNRMVWSSGFGTGRRFGGGDYMHSLKYVRDASVIAIRRHPALYAKFVWANMVEFFAGIGYKYDIESSLEYRATGPIPSEVHAADLTKDQGPPAAPPPATARRVTGADADAGGSGSEHVLKRLQLGWQSFHGVVYQNVAWSWAYLVVSALGAAQLARSRGRHLGAFLLVVLALFPLGASLVVCMFEVALDRYSYPTQFACYLSVALFPLLWYPGGRGRPSGSPAAGGSAAQPART